MKSQGISSWFRGIKGRLMFTAILPIIGFAILFGVSTVTVNRYNAMLTVYSNTIVPNLQYIGEMRQSRNKFAYQALAAMDADNDTDRAKSIASAMEGVEEFKSNYKSYAEAPFLPTEAQMFEPAKVVIGDFYKAMDSILELVKTNDPEKINEARKLLKGPYTKFGGIVRNFNRDVAKLYEETSEKQQLEAKALQKEAANMLIATSVVAGIAIFSILCLFAARMSGAVASIASRLTDASSNVASSVEQLSEASNSLSHSSTEAAASLEETVAALEELTSMVQMNSDNAKQAASLSGSSRQAAEEGETDIKNLITAMTQISQSSRKIEEIISVIDDIAFQTNLLALNAAVEAARAGEQGKGFAVVAEAVRALAQRSASSAKDISSLIKESVSQIERGSEIADQSGTVLANIVNSIKKVSDLNNEIAAASGEQTTGIQQISKAMNQLDQASQSNAASSEEIAATGAEINGLATTAQGLTVELNKLVLGVDKSMIEA
ncbi:methyl-accepting chemotaxis protein [Bdellovibrio sp. KM01]|uniref:methyl-accepting chemotaxis protein n=1 Tax=Bdellovibrio sp. KM01 TaxID=2748865 RepID=UPI0015E9CABF|nr:methyl-accepting chemotaxis protein [Bdellovibrio sp. KM01]QLY26783.1 MCP four helix bundle domain-containing protein [Bdellovibrio sp. KM01]